MKVHAYYLKKAGFGLIHFCILALGLAVMSYLMNCHAQEATQRGPGRLPVEQPSKQSVQQPPSQQIPQQLDTPGAMTAITDVTEDYLINPGDVIDIEVDRAPELSGSKRVSASGTIRMDYLGHIKAQGVTTDELASFIANSLSERYLKNPRVNVTVKQMNSQNFFIQGAVNHPGAYQIEGRPSLLTLIAVAGGLSENYGSTAFILRGAYHSKGGVTEADLSKETLDSQMGSSPSLAVARESKPESEETEKFDLLKVNLNGLFKGDYDKNIRLDPGTIVNIPLADVFFVGGDVNAPGSFRYKEGATLRQAITIAQGMKYTAASDRVIIFRQDPVTGQKQEIKVDAGKIMNGKEEDVSIAANDIVIIPNSRTKSVSAAILGVVGYNYGRIP